MNYYEKYLKYKTKYLILAKNTDKYDKILSETDNDNTDTDNITITHSNIQEGGSKKYACKPNKQKYKEICLPDDKGEYKTEKDCYEECDTKFISVQLKKANLHKESLQFYYFIKSLINKEQMSIYIKGGNVIGLAVLKLIHDKYPGTNSKSNFKFKQAFEKFLKLELIKDWDFTGYTNKKEINEQYRTKLDKLSGKFGLVPRAKTFILYQTKYPILIYNKALFEIAILDSDSSEFSKMEIPMTTMKVSISIPNIKYIFMLAKSFYSWTEKHIPIDLDIVRKILSSIDIIIHPHKSGLYDPGKKIDTGELNKNLVEFIWNFTKKNAIWTQFIITQLEDPYRLIYRMCEKNIVKTDKIIDYIKKNLHINKLPSWLLDSKKTMNVINKFIDKLGNKLADIYLKENNLDKVLDFLLGTNFGKPQIQIEWDEFSKQTKLRLKKIFEPMVNKIGLDEFSKIVNSRVEKFDSKSSNLTSSDKIVKLFKFLIDKKIFE